LPGSAHSEQIEAEMARAAKGKINARKEGGGLTQPGTQGTRGRKKGRMVRSRGAEMDGKTSAMRTEVFRFQRTLEDLRKRLATAKAELAELEGRASRAASAPRPETPTGEGDEEHAADVVEEEPVAPEVLEAKRQEVKAAEVEVKAKEGELNRKVQKLTSREEDMDRFKGKERSKLAKSSAKNIERKRSVAPTLSCMS
jgi:chromosome segregation ATPase